VHSKMRFLDVTISTILCITILCCFCLASENTWHWMLIPAFYCGVLFGIDLVGWWRRSIDLYDPNFFISLIGFHAFFIAPILHLYWNMLSGDIHFTGDWKHWMAVMCIINAVCLTFYRCAQTFGFKFSNCPTTRWAINRQKLFIFFLPIIIVSLLSQIYIYFHFEGVKKYFDLLREGAANLTGMGWIMVFADPFPLILFAVFLMILGKSLPSARHSAYVYFLLFIFIIIQFFWSGLRGSRSAIVYPLVIAAGFLHYYIRPFSRREVIIGLVVVIAFLYSYAFYKETRWYKGETFSFYSVVTDVNYRKKLEEKTGRTIKGVLLGDLARNDVQARIAAVVVGKEEAFDLRYGITYLGAFSLIVPDWIWEVFTENPKPGGTAKREAFLELNWGKSSIQRFGRQLPKRVYGLSGEAMMNFGIPGTIFAYSLLGFSLGLYRRKLVSLSRDDSRLYIAPILTLMFVHFLFLDMSNVIWFFFRQGILLVFLVCLSSDRTKLISNA
jgi:hypothetical protein